MHRDWVMGGRFLKAKAGQRFPLQGPSMQKPIADMIFGPWAQVLWQLAGMKLGTGRRLAANFEASGCAMVGLGRGTPSDE